MCEPRFATRRRVDRSNRLERVELIAGSLGLELMPWQRQVISVATEELEDGSPAWSEVFVTTPRQAGKTTLILLLLLERCLGWGRPQYCVWTGQDGKSIRKKWMREIVPLLERSNLSPYISRVRRSNGDEAVEW